MAPGWSVRVPASTSNVGPGFDLLGLALDLHLDARVRPAEDGRRTLARSGAGERELPDADRDLLLRAFERVRARVPFPGVFRFEVRSEIPVGRGLGSSGAAIAAGLLLARACSGAALGDAELLALGVELEGHPDNVAAALHGGLTLCARTAAGWTILAPPLADTVGFAVAWPREPLETPRARAALPATVAFADATENPRRLAFLLEGLRRGDPALIAWGGEERLHVRYRLPLLAGAERALAAGRAAGAWLTTLSGAGSGVLALGPRGAMEPVARAMADELRAATGEGTGRVLAPVSGPPRVTELPG